MLKSRNFIRFIIVVALLSLLVFLYGFIKEVGIGHLTLYILLTTALMFKIIKILFEWYHYAGIPASEPTKAISKINLSVDMLTTACPGEPYEMIEETLRAMVAVKYPHQNYLCDEGNDPILRQLCKNLGVIHVTRDTHENAKAGNINNALTQAKGEICVILDPDHAPFPDFLDHVLSFFEDPKVGYVQVVQAYKNQVETFVARAAAEQTYNFYGPFMQSMGKFGTAQAIGANCTFRRKALDSIGGHAPGLTEDMHTSMLLHANGWKSVYVSKILSRGLVPTSLSAYYSQQLKWSRGTFDLWFNLFPKLFRKFTWKQKIHYGLMPVYYLFGLIALIDITVPIISLLSGEYPWLLDPLIFYYYFVPFMICHLLVRLYAQRWLHDSHEQGLHVFGGLLRVGSWWIYILGFIYTLLNIKVPYIPTPKEHTSKNEFLLGLPNLVVAALSIAAAVYGLNQDWQPYSFMMAAFAISNGIIFFLAFAIGQSRWVFAFRNLWKEGRAKKPIAKLDISYHHFSKITAPIIIICLIVSSFFLIQLPSDSNSGEMEKTLNKINIGGFYTGIQLPTTRKESGLESIFVAEKEVDHSWSVISSSLLWSSDPLPTALWQSIIEHGAIPMITWEPRTNLFDEYKDHPDLSQNKRVFRHISEGYFDDYIDQMAVSIRSLGFPVFLRFAHEMDNPKHPWSTTGGNLPEDFVAAWRYIHDRFEILGVQNVTWVWNPWEPSAIETYFPSGKAYPESRYVDWIGISCFNYGTVGPDGRWKSFEELYQPLQKRIQELGIDLPIMISELGSTSYGGDAISWNKNVLKEIQDKHPEILSAVLYYQNPDSSHFEKENSQEMDWTYEYSSISDVLSNFDTPRLAIFQQAQKETKDHQNRLVRGAFGNFSLEVDGKQFYIKGICYSAGDEWREGFLPLSRKQLEHDFKQIKEMGANTIRRYEPSIYDRNILKIAEENDLKVMYGFWFDPAIDYYGDEDAVKAYEKKVLNYVRKYKNEKSIVAWNIGNETWGLLKKNFEKPYLTLTRRAYLNFLERLAQKIHQLDPSRPVFSTEEHEYYQMASTLHEMATYAPSLDVIGVNSYYKESIQGLKEEITKFDTLRPYVVTEFGPKGYWSQEFGDYKDDNLLIELSSLSKAKWYDVQWKDYIEFNKGYNLGGFAFSWRDRYEGTATWFGITDYKGRLKPTYYYLQRAWLGDNLTYQEKFPEIAIVGHWYPLASGEKIWLSAATVNGYEGKLKYEWEVFDEGSWNKSTAISSTMDDNKFVEIIMPSGKSNSRVYVYATDTLGNVVTASRPLIFQ